MRVRAPFVAQLLDLPRLKNAEERRAIWRQTMATLAQETPTDGPSALDSVNRDALLAAAKVVLETGLADDLDWLAAPAAGAALFELASALPLGAEQRELGRRVLSRMLAGNAETFAAIATRMALGAGKGLGSPGVRARIALLTELPVSSGVADGPLAMALVGRRPLAREFVVQGSMASLAARRLAARLLERAAREAARRAQQGDEHPMRAFAAEGVAQAFERLLLDRETLVWRHVAVARGLLAPWMPAFRRTLTEHLDPRLSPTEWRRAATSIAANLAVEPEEARRGIKVALGVLLERDRGVAGALVWGLARAAEAEPDAAAEVLDEVAKRAPADVAEAAVELGLEWGTGRAFEHAVAHLIERLGESAQQPERSLAAADEEGREVLARELLRDLERLPRRGAAVPEGDPRDEPLRVQVARALEIYAADGARPAYAAAKVALEAAGVAVDALFAIAQEEHAEGNSGALARRTELAVFRDLDVGLLERGTLIDLLRLGPGGEAVQAHVDAVDQLQHRIAEFVLTQEATEPEGEAHGTLRMRRLRALLHLVDADSEGEDSARNAKLRLRLTRVGAALLRRLEKGLPPSLRRANSATLARALDALVRAEAFDPADALLVVAGAVDDPQEFRVLAEASMDTELRHAFARCAAFLAALRESREAAAGRSGSMRPISAAEALEPHLVAFEAWTKDLFLDPTSRAESLRTVLVRIHQAARAISATSSLAGMCAEEGTDPTVLVSLEGALDALAQLAAAARSRLDVSSAPLPDAVATPLALLVSRVLAGAEEKLDEAAFLARTDELLRGVPRVVALLVRDVVLLLLRLPVRIAGASLEHRAPEQLPAWLPPRRTLGGFYVMRALGSGGGGSVFVASRVEERNEASAELFALKVPDYSASAARSLSEAEFLAMFRAEASALMSVPAHTNLARFVTFDTASRPKPILVMELVEGSTFEHVLASGGLTVSRALGVLDDVLAGLEAMHGVEVGHLDVKPSNVVLRHGKEGVLVDFGLAGRHVRPGCATGPYGAPEVWGALGADAKITPAKADVYAFGCAAFEALTGKVLFDANSELTLIAKHLSHDGFPEPVKALAQRPELVPMAELLFSTLRRDPSNRPAVPALRAELRRVAPALSRLAWPLVPA